MNHSVNAEGVFQPISTFPAIQNVGTSAAKDTGKSARDSLPQINLHVSDLIIKKNNAFQCIL